MVWGEDFGGVGKSREGLGLAGVGEWGRAGRGVAARAGGRVVRLAGVFILVACPVRQEAGGRWQAAGWTWQLAGSRRHA